MNAKVFVQALACGAVLLAPGAARAGLLPAGAPWRPPGSMVLAADTPGRGTGIGTEPRTGGAETASPAGRAGTGRYEGTIPPGAMAPGRDSDAAHAGSSARCGDADRTAQTNGGKDGCTAKPSE